MTCVDVDTDTDIDMDTDTDLNINKDRDYSTIDVCQPAAALVESWPLGRSPRSRLQLSREATSNANKYSS